jgi:hypothetical protein
VMNDVKWEKCTVQSKCQQVQSNPNKLSQYDRQYIRICTLLTAMKFNDMSYACHAKNDDDKCLNVCLDTGRWSVQFTWTLYHWVNVNILDT